MRPPPNSNKHWTIISWRTATFIPQQAIGHRSPIDALASWYAQHPELFIAPVMIKEHNQTELDTPPTPPGY
jgi:hypothetical protein